MSTQAARSILFTHTSPQQGFKLLELPAELADALSSDEPPTIELKSSPPLATTPNTETTPNINLGDTTPTTTEFVNLCTPTQTYQVRQVQSSNSIHIIRPSGEDAGVQRGDISIVVGGEGDDTGNGGGEDEEINLVETMTAIAKCGSTLELYSPPGGFSAVPYLERMVGVYDGEGGLDGASAGVGAGGFETVETAEQEQVIRGVFEDVPVAGVLCERGWVEVCAFVLSSTASAATSTGHGYGYGHGGNVVMGLCRRPSARARLDVWKKVLEGAVLQGVDLEKQFLVGDLWRALLDEDGEEPFPRALFEAVVRRVCEVGEKDGGGLFARLEMKWANIDKDSCMRWVGETYLEAMAPSAQSALGRGQFLNAWKDHLPESWRTEVTLSKLPDGPYRLPDPTSICFVNEVDRQKLKKNVSTDASAATAAKKTRNWHELFKNQKRQKR